jgi:hypothetical protein
MRLLEQVRAMSLAAVAVALVIVPRSEIAAADPPKKATPEPAWKQEFRTQYGLKDGEHIKRIAAPYPKCRSEYLTERFGGGGNFAFDDYFTVLRWKGHWAPLALATHVVPVKPDVGIALGSVLDMTCAVPRTRIEDPDQLLDVKVIGDFVVRDESKPADIAKQLEAILKKECNLEATLRFREVEREVYVLSGKYEAKPLEGRKKTAIEIFGKSLIDRGIGGGGTGTFAELLANVERHVNAQVEAGKIEGMPGRLSWHYNVRSPMIKDPANGIDTLAEDTNVHAVLANLADQTGLKVKVEKRKVQMLKIERATAKK